MEFTVLVFLGVALLIVALALFLGRSFSRSIKEDREHDDLNADSRDGRGTATWIGINRGKSDLDP